MGLKKPVKTGSDLPTLNELVGVDAVPVETDGYIVLDTVPGQACAMESNTPIFIKAELGRFGDATAADVAEGKTFTSAAGLKVAGTGKIDNLVMVESFSGNGLKVAYISLNTELTSSHIIEIVSAHNTITRIPCSILTDNIAKFPFNNKTGAPEIMLSLTGFSTHSGTLAMICNSINIYERSDS